MSNRKYTEEHIREWSEEHFPLVDTASDNADMETHLRNVLIEGSTYFDKYPIAANRTLHKLKPINR